MTNGYNNASVFTYGPDDLLRIREVEKIPEAAEIPDVFQPFLAVVEEKLASDSSGHDFEHATRVLKLALSIQKTEGGDRFIIGIAALFHDLMRPWEKEQKKQKIPVAQIKSHFSKEAIKLIRDEIERLKPLISDAQIEKVLEIIALHEDYELKSSAKSIELKVVQDADWLDAIGAVGLLRAAMFAGSYGDKMFIPGESLAKGGFQESQSKKGVSLLHHIYEKLLALGDMMNTKTGNKMASMRNAHMCMILDFFYSELREIEN